MAIGANDIMNHSEDIHFSQDFSELVVMNAGIIGANMCPNGNWCRCCLGMMKFGQFGCFCCVHSCCLEPNDAECTLSIPILCS